MTMTLEELDRAASLVYRVMAPTPQYAWPKLRSRIGCNVWVKHENHTPTGAFKVRGGLVYMDRLTRAQPGVPRDRDRHARQSWAVDFIFGRLARVFLRRSTCPHGNSPDQNDVHEHVRSPCRRVRQGFR